MKCLGRSFQVDCEEVSAGDQGSVGQDWEASDPQCKCISPFEGAHSWYCWSIARRILAAGWPTMNGCVRVEYLLTCASKNHLKALYYFKDTWQLAALYEPCLKPRIRFSLLSCLNAGGALSDGQQSEGWPNGQGQNGCWLWTTERQDPWHMGAGLGSPPTTSTWNNPWHGRKSLPLAALTVHQVDGDSPKWVMRRSSRSQKFARHSREAASSNLLTALARARLLFPSSTNCRQQLQPEDCLAPATGLHASAAMLILTFSHLLPSCAIVLLRHLLDSMSRPNTFKHIKEEKVQGVKVHVISMPQDHTRCVCVFGCKNTEWDDWDPLVGQTGKKDPIWHILARSPLNTWELAFSSTRSVFRLWDWGLMDLWGHENLV